MDLMLNIDLKKLPRPIRYTDKLMLIGSCFTEHIGNSLSRLKFNIMQNPNGILFDPESVARSLVAYIENTPARDNQLFKLNETWNSWSYHSRFSGTDRQKTLDGINASMQKAHEFLRNTDWLIITLGSA